MKRKSLIILTDVIFGSICLFVLIEVLFFGSWVVWLLLDLIIWANTRLSLEIGGRK